MSEELAPAVTAELATLASEINEQHRLFEGALRRGLAHAFKAGELLNKAKALCSHGEWLPWLADNFEGSERMAERYMKLARERSVLEAKSDTVSDLSDLSQREALAMLVEPEPQRFVVRTVPGLSLHGGRGEGPPQEAVPVRVKVTTVPQETLRLQGEIIPGPPAATWVGRPAGDDGVDLAEAGLRDRERRALLDSLWRVIQAAEVALRFAGDDLAPRIAALLEEARSIVKDVEASE